MGKSNLLGAWGESLAANYLEKKRYRLVARGFRCRFGEIDLIVESKKYIVFVEVKLRRSAAFARAAERGFGIEMDIQLTKDKVPVVFHDFTLKRACRTSGKVIDYTYDELKKLELFRSQEHIPTFEEALAVVDGRVPIIVELKIEWSDYRVCRIADSILRNYKGDYAIESFNPLALLWFRKNHKEVVRGQLSDHFRKEGTATVPFYFLLHYLTLNFLTKPDFIAYNHKYSKNMSRQICRYLYGASAAGWTIKSEEQLKKAKENFDWFIFDGFIPGERSTNG